MSRREMSRKEVELYRVIRTRFPHPTMRWPSLDFVAGAFMGAVLAVVDNDNRGKMGLSWKPIENSQHGDCVIQFILGSELVMNDIEFAKSLIGMYGWEWVDMTFAHDGLVTVVVRPMVNGPQNGEYMSGDDVEMLQPVNLEEVEKTETDGGEETETQSE